MDVKLLPIDETGMSVRSCNALHRIGVHTVGDMLKYDAESLSGIRNLGSKSVSEILEKIAYYNELNAAPPAVAPAHEAYIDDAQKVIDYLKASKVKTEVLELLPARAYNMLVFSGYDRLEKFVFMTEDELMCIRGMDESSARDIVRACKRYIRENREMIEDFAQQISADAKKKPLTISDILRDVTYRSEILKYLRANDIAVLDMGLSTRPRNALINNGYSRMSSIIFLTRNEIDKLGGLGSGSVDEVCNMIRLYLDTHGERIIQYINGDTSVLVTDKKIRDLVLDVYRTMGFGGLSVSELAERLKDTVELPHDRLKKVLGQLVAEGVLEYVDYRCYKTYTRFADYYVDCDIDDRSKQIVKGRLAGLTLDEIGTELSITRERVRQLSKKSVEKIRLQYISETGNDLFDEDYYRYLYETYGFDHDESSRWLGVTDEVWNYFEIAGVKKGTTPLDAAIKDVSHLEAGLRLRIKNFINRNRIYIDGKWIEKRRTDLEPVIVKKFCADEVTFTDFVDIFNNYLVSEGIPFDEKLYYTDEVLATRKNRFQESHFLLWKLGERFRYYDIDGQDFTELFEVFDLGSYKNVELSTVKFVEEYPELMEKYDIRDGYELHNLLKKALESDSYGIYPELKFSKMPTIRFGTPDRDSAMFDMMVDNAPISMNDLCELIHREYGYDMKMIPNYLQHIMVYYHDGMFTIDQKEMSFERRMAFKKAFTEDFYYIDELREQYLTKFPDADAEEINSYNLKQMGFVVNSKYVIQHFDSAEDYFTYLLTNEEVTDISTFKHRYSTLETYYSIYLRLREDLEIVEFEQDKLITIGRLEKFGITKGMISDFCNEVYDNVDDGVCFSIQSLKKKGYYSEMFDIGFDDFFCGNLLLSDNRFSRKKLMGTMIYKGKKDITYKDFVADIVKRECSIDLYDLDTLLREEYGCDIIDKYDLVFKTRDADIFYDSELQRFYADQELYYREIDENGGL